MEPTVPDPDGPGIEPSGVDRPRHRSTHGEVGKHDTAENHQDGGTDQNAIGEGIAIEEGVSVVVTNCKIGEPDGLAGQFCDPHDITVLSRADLDRLNVAEQAPGREGSGENP